MNANTMAHLVQDTRKSWLEAWRVAAQHWRKPEFASLDARRQPLAELKRLAETSPHLLADAGLVQDAGLNGERVQTWRCDTLNVVVVIDDTGARVTETTI